MEKIYSCDDEMNSVDYVDVVISYITDPLSTPFRRKSKTQAQRQREYRLRQKQKKLNRVEEKKKTMKAQIPGKKTGADYQREYRLRKKLRAQLNSGSAETIQTQKAGPCGLFDRREVQSRDEYPQNAFQDCECQSTIKVERTEPHPVLQIQAVPSVEIVPISENQITQEIGEALVTPDTGDKYDVFGKYLASKVRQLDFQQRMYVERIIHEAIYEGQMGHLNDNSKLVVNTETFVTSQSSYNKTIRSEVKVERAKELEMQETGPDLEEKAAIEDENEFCSYSAGCAVRKKRLKTPEHSKNVAGIKLEIETEENEYLPGNLGTQYYDTDTRNSTIHGSHYSDDAKRKKNNETHPELQGFKLKTEIDIEENWIPQETHLDNVSKFETEIELRKIKCETDDGLG